VPLRYQQTGARFFRQCGAIAALSGIDFRSLSAVDSDSAIGTGDLRAHAARHVRRIESPVNWRFNARQQDWYRDQL